jgi:hypothetical protein
MIKGWLGIYQKWQGKIYPDMDIQRMLQPEKRWLIYIVPQVMPLSKQRPLPKYTQHLQTQLQKELMIENSSSYLYESIGNS